MESYYSIPSVVMLNPKLSSNSKLLYAIILSLSNISNCYASNGWFAQQLNVKPRSISLYIKELYINNCISINGVIFDNSTYSKLLEEDLSEEDLKELEKITRNPRRLIKPLYVLGVYNSPSSKVESENIPDYVKNFQNSIN